MVGAAQLQLQLAGARTNYSCSSSMARDAILRAPAVPSSGHRQAHIDFVFARLDQIIAGSSVASTTAGLSPLSVAQTNIR